MTIKEYKKLWESTVKDKVEYQEIQNKLLLIRFDRRGNMKGSKWTHYGRKHFPHLIEYFYFRVEKQERRPDPAAAAGAPAIKQLNLF